MEENIRTERRKKNPDEKKDDGLFAVGLCQSVFAVIIVLTVLFVSKGTGTAAQNLRDDFALLMSVSYEKEDVKKTWSSIRDYFSSPANLSVFKAFENEEQTTQQTEKQTESSTAAEESTTAKPKEKEDETTSLKAEEKTSEKESSTKKINLSLTKKSDFSKSVTASKVKMTASQKTSQQIIMPVSGPYTSYFGARTNPITGVDSFHTGLDIAAAQGTKIKAAYSGVVRKVGEDSRSGKYIYLTHENGVETLYCHCSAVLAELGASIRQGETIALVGSTGWSTGPHLHFEFHKNGERLDPLPILADIK